MRFSPIPAKARATDLLSFLVRCSHSSLYTSTKTRLHLSCRCLEEKTHGMSLTKGNTRLEPKDTSSESFRERFSRHILFPRQLCQRLKCGQHPSYPLQRSRKTTPAFSGCLMFTVTLVRESYITSIKACLACSSVFIFSSITKGLSRYERSNMAITATNST